MTDVRTRPASDLAKKNLETFTESARDNAIKAFLARRPQDLPELPKEREISVKALKPEIKRFHGVKTSLLWFPWWKWRTQCSDKFGYLAPLALRNSTKLPFTPAVQTLLGKLGDFMADPARGAGADSAMPAGFTYFGQFVDHDITLDVESKLDVEQDATKISNMRSPACDLDAVYGQGPAIDAFLYRFPTAGPPSAVKFVLGTNTNTGDGGPAGAAGTSAAMQTQTDFDLPRMAGTLTAIIGDPRNDENLIVSQFHMTMLKFHNEVVDGLVAASFAGDIFVEAKRLVTHHYQWALVNDYLERVCGAAAVSAALSSVSAAIGSAFAMPVEFAVAAYRFGHSQIRSNYWHNFNFINATLDQEFEFNRPPRLPVFSNWVCDFNAFFQTGFTVPVNNKAKKIDSVLAPGLDTLPGFTGMMAMLATRNLRRGQALGLPSGQGMAQHYGIAPMTAAQLKQGLPPGEVALLDSEAGILLQKTPLWYYVLREAMVLTNGERLGPVGGRIVAETFVRMLKRDRDSFLNVSGGFTPVLPSAVAGDFTVADLVNLAKVTVP